MLTGNGLDVTGVVLDDAGDDVPDDAGGTLDVADWFAVPPGGVSFC